MSSTGDRSRRSSSSVEYEFPLGGLPRSNLQNCVCKQTLHSRSRPCSRGEAPKESAFTGTFNAMCNTLCGGSAIEVLGPRTARICNAESAGAAASTSADRCGQGSSCRNRNRVAGILQLAGAARGTQFARAPVSVQSRPSSNECKCPCSSHRLALRPRSEALVQPGVCDFW
jgi:hypothetical protein